MIGPAALRGAEGRTATGRASRHQTYVRYLADKAAVVTAAGSLPNLRILDKESVFRYTPHTMKSDIHPTYTHEAKVLCMTCGTTFVTGSTIPELRVEVCSHCHPFFTGKQNIVDTAGRVDRYKRLASKQSGAGQPLRSKRQKLQAKEARRTPKAQRES